MPRRWEAAARGSGAPPRKAVRAQPPRPRVCDCVPRFRTEKGCAGALSGPRGTRQDSSVKPGELRRGKTFTRDLDVTKAELKSRVDDGQPLSAAGGGGDRGGASGEGPQVPRRRSRVPAGARSPRVNVQPLPGRHFSVKTLLCGKEEIRCSEQKSARYLGLHSEVWPPLAWHIGVPVRSLPVSSSSGGREAQGQGPARPSRGRANAEVCEPGELSGSSVLRPGTRSLQTAWGQRPRFHLPLGTLEPSD